MTKPKDGATARPLEWIDIRDTNGRKSSLGYGGRLTPNGYLHVTGNLEHGADIKPCTDKDAAKLCDVVTHGQFSALLAVAEAGNRLVNEATHFIENLNGGAHLLSAIEQYNQATFALAKLREVQKA